MNKTKTVHFSSIPYRLVVCWVGRIEYHFHISKVGKSYNVQAYDARTHEKGTYLIHVRSASFSKRPTNSDLSTLISK